MTESWQPTIPGLSLPTGEPTSLEAAAVATIRVLEDQNLLGPEHALTAQLVLELAKVIGAQVRTGRTSTTPLAAKQILEALDSLPKPAAPIDGDGWAELVAALGDDEGAWTPETPTADA